MKNKATLTQGAVGPALFKMSASMMIGFIAGAAFNMTDTWFVAKLGTRELAAMGFTFPIVMIVHGLVMGVGVGTASVLSRAIGEGNQDRIQKLTMHSLMLGFCMVCIFVACGYAFMEPVFRLMGATEDLLPLVMDYMRIWLAGILVVVIPMLGNNAIRATGDTLSPSLIMTADLGVNIILDPIFIFGIGPIPAMGIQGAALATVLSRVLALIASLYILGHSKKMLTSHGFKINDILKSWWQILYIGLPAGATNLLTPLTAGIITKLISEYGTASVAALSAGTRIEFCVVIPLIAMGASMVPFIGQNWGAGAFDRVKSAQRLSYLTCIGWGLFCIFLLAVSGDMIAPLFTKDTEVVKALTVYLGIMPVAFGFRGISMSANGTLNAINRPLDSSLSMIIRLIVLQWPLAVLGSKLFGYPGILVGIVIAEVIVAPITAGWAYFLCHHQTRHQKSRMASTPDVNNYGDC